MELKSSAMAGTLESCDILVTLHPNPGRGVEIQLESPVKAQFGDAILETVRNTLSRLGVTDAHVELRDRGALDCVIAARTQCAICRAAGIPYDWSKEDDAL